MCTVSCTLDSVDSLSPALKDEQESVSVPLPVVQIIQDPECDATTVEISFGDRLGLLIDTMKALKDLGLDVVKGIVTTQDSVKKTKFLITRLDTGRKVEDPDLLENIRLTIINNLIKYHPESSERLAMGETFGIKAPEKKGVHRTSFRKISTVAATAAENKEGLKFLVTAGPYARKMVGIWLFVSAAWVFSMVVLGGVTRLTRSGLSMTDWKFTGSLPPLTDEDWLVEFDKYKQSPEYKRVNKGMNIEDFKFIYWMEYAHRMWGRALGIMFALPFSYFVRKGYITVRLGFQLSGLFALGAGQGLIGWWMVKSGLEEPASEYVEPRVSPYRFAAHLTSAFAIYCGLFWTALSVVMPEPPAESLACVRGAAKVKRLAIPVGILVGITAISGAFVAGNDAGWAFNTFPKMGDTWIPDDIFSMKPLIRNFFENTSTVQVTLGISTLLSYVPVSLGTAHQAGALTLLTFMVLLNHTVRRPSPALL